MKSNEPLFPQRDGFSTVGSGGETASAIRAIATREHDVIRRWAERHRGEPSTGIETKSGAATLKVSDGGSVLRFNFPAAARFRPISWEEWFEIFEERGLVFVYEEDVVDRAYGLSQARGGEWGHDLDDWHEAERQMAVAGPPSARYRFVQRVDDAAS